VHSISSLEGLEWAEEDRNEWAVQATLRLDGDDLVEVRAAAARALTAVGGPGVAPSLARALTVNSFELRDAAEGALFAIAERSDGVAVARALFAIASGETAAPASGRDAALRVLGSTDHRDAWEVLQAALKSADPVTRSAAIEGSVRLKARGLRKALQELLATESAALNKASIERALSDRSIR
jgi:HEAT repeat protein